jgi:glycerol kinase
MHTGDHAFRSKNRLLTTRAASFDGTPQYALEGAVFVAGATVQWMRDELDLMDSAEESESIARSVADTGGVYLVPAFVGLGAPHWDASARGLICGLTRATTRSHLVRAGLESIAFQTRELVEAMEADSGEEVVEMRVDGGASANDFLMQFQADILDCRIVRPADTETTALGAAYLSGLAVGFWDKVEDIAGFWQVDHVFEPQISDSRRASLCDGWKEAVHRAASDNKPE